MKNLKNTSLQRRQFLQYSTSSLCTFYLGAKAPYLLAATQAELTPLFEDTKDLSLLQEPDANGLRLPAGFKSRIIAHSTRPVSGSDYLWHNSPDGGACFAAENSGWIYVSNSEVRLSEGGGGVGAVRFDSQGNIVDAYSILSGTDNNCAGGKTPWNTWLSCEEVDRGLVYECDPYGVKAAIVRPALGSFKHEAAAIDPRNGHVFLTEDEPDGGFYRFLPTNPLPDLTAGRLQIAEVSDSGGKMEVIWHDVPDPSARLVRTSHQVGATRHFDGGEGIAWHNGYVYFTTKGDNRVWCYETSSQELTVLYDYNTSDSPHLSGVDNVTITASGDLLVAEDGGDMQIVLLTPAGAVMPIVQVTGQDESEICGPAFDPSYQRLYFSSQTGPKNRDDDGITYEISRIG